MIWMDAEIFADLAAIVWLDVVLSGDNALVIGMAASGLAVHLQRRAILFGMMLAVAIRIAAALVATYLYEIPWIKFVGGLALLWVALKLYQELRNISALKAEATSAVVGSGAAQDRRSLMKALATITIADVSMSIDNVLAVASIAQDNRVLLVFGLVLSIMLMAFCATMVCKVLLRYPWISYVGVALLVVVAGDMLHSSWDDMALFMGMK
ncbi:MAG TPA: YjbE family putative metal transport protein [Thermohalobaculum sp.]|nr:YjbE family putative metal transport protein [Thermohalobaculum sp.]